MLEFLQPVVTLPAPIHAAILAGVTLLLGLLLSQLAALWPALAAYLGQYKDEFAVTLAGAIVAYINGLLAQIPPTWEGVGAAALQLIVAVLAALGLVFQFRKARAIRRATSAVSR